MIGLYDCSYRMAIGDKTATDGTPPVGQKGTQPDPHRQPPRSGEGSTRSSEPLADLGRLLEQVFANRDNESLGRSRVSRAQRNFHRQKPPTCSVETRLWRPTVGYLLLRRPFEQQLFGMTI